MAKSFTNLAGLKSILESVYRDVKGFIAHEAERLNKNSKIKGRN